MIRTILVPLDGSRTAEHALPWARSLSRCTGATVRLARVRRIPPAPVAGEGMTTYDPDPYTYITKEEDEYMAAAAKAWLDPESETILTGVLLEPNDSIAGTLIQYAGTVAADLTIMTSRGHGPVSRFLFGSVADEYLRRAPGPTLLIQGDAEKVPDPSVEPRVSRVIVPLDGSALSEQAATPALTLFDWYGCEITLLLVLDAVEDIRQLMERVGGSISHLWTPQTALPIASEYLQQVANRLRRKTSKVRTKVVEHGSAAEVILAEAAEPTTAIALAISTAPMCHRYACPSWPARRVRPARMAPAVSASRFTVWWPTLEVASIIYGRQLGRPTEQPLVKQEPLEPGQAALRWVGRIALASATPRTVTLLAVAETLGVQISDRMKKRVS